MTAFSRYGPIWECWWDGAGSTKAHYDWKRWADIVRKFQPQCVIFGCLGAAEYVDVRWVGNESGCAGDPCYATIEPSSIEVENTGELNRGKWGGTAASFPRRPIPPSVPAGFTTATRMGK